RAWNDLVVANLARLIIGFVGKLQADEHGTGEQIGRLDRRAQPAAEQVAQVFAPLLVGPVKPVVDALRLDGQENGNAVVVQTGVIRRYVVGHLRDRTDANAAIQHRRAAGEAADRVVQQHEIRDLIGETVLARRMVGWVKLEVGTIRNGLSGLEAFRQAKRGAAHENGLQRTAAHFHTVGADVHINARAHPELRCVGNDAAVWRFYKDTISHVVIFSGELHVFHQANSLPLKDDGVAYVERAGRVAGQGNGNARRIAAGHRRVLQDLEAVGSVLAGAGPELDVSTRQQGS